MSQENEVSVHLVVSGRGFDTDACTHQVGIPPTRVWRQGNKALLGRQDLPDTEWSVGVEKVECDSLDEVAGRVLDIVWPSRTELSSFTDTNGLELVLSCTVTILRERPEYSLSPQNIKRLAELGAGLLLDVIDYSEDTDDP